MTGSLIVPLLASALLALADPPARSLSREEVLAAMKLSRGFDATATTNGARLQAEVILRLARQARERDPQGPPLLVGHAEWFSAYLEFTSLAPDKAPLFVRLANDYNQDLEVDYRVARVLDRCDGAAPLLAVNVRISWPEVKGRATRYSYEDMLATPHLKATDHSLITYRLLDFGDRVAFAEIEGLTGRPTSGVLGLLFAARGTSWRTGWPSRPTACRSRGRGRERRSSRCRAR